jgi:hypothetical protein
VWGLMGFQHKLYGAVHDKVGLLMTLDVDQAVALLVDQRHMVPPAAVVAQLRAESAAGGGDAGGGRVAKGCDMRYCLHRYLDALFSADQTEGGEFHALQVRVSSGGNPTLHCPKRKPYAPLWLYLKRLPDPYRRNSLMQVELYVEYDPERLMHFLQASQSYPLERALELCRRARMVREMVFILGRMGSTRKALSLIMNELHDIEQAIGTPPASKPLGRHHPTRPPPTLSHATVPCAVFFVATATEFVQGQQDEELWDELISNSLGSPELVGALLERIGRYTDPLGLIRRLPPGMDIPHLRDRLVQIVAAYRTQASLRHGCNAILRADCAALSGAPSPHSWKKKKPRVGLALRGSLGPVEGVQTPRCDEIYLFVCA